MHNLNHQQVNFLTIDEDNYLQRLDNFLFLHFKIVPRAHIYKIINSGEVRVNKCREKNTYKLQIGDIIRIPPISGVQKPQIQTDKTNKNNKPNNTKLKVLYEDEHLLAVLKPHGMAVHGGSGVSLGVIEYLRNTNKYNNSFLELVHRLDKETSGVLLLAKKRSALTNLHEQIRAGKCNKKYIAIVCGHWLNAKQNLTYPLSKTITADQQRKVYVDLTNGQESHTIVYLKKHINIANLPCSLLDIELKTGRTHQIRVHLSYSGFPLLGDEKYGNFNLNKSIQTTLSKVNPDEKYKYRMYLHAYSFGFMHPKTGEYLIINSIPAWVGEEIKFI